MGGEYILYRVYHLAYWGYLGVLERVKNGNLSYQKRVEAITFNTARASAGACRHCGGEARREAGFR